MKIFNWMQKCLAPNVLKDGVLTRNVKKRESIAIDGNTKSLLEEVTFVDVLDGWKDGILTIGTFGFDPLTPVTTQETEETKEIDEECEILSQEIQKFEDEEEEISPLMFNISEIGSDSDAITAVDEGEEAVLTPLPVEFSVFNEKGVDTNEIGVDTTKYAQGKLPRKTLAELFMEDFELKTKKVSPESGKNSSGKAKKGGLSFAKKLIAPSGDKNSSSAKKIQKVMRKMLKRKIHPAVEGNSKPNCLNKEGVLDKSVELVSLLQIPDVGVQASF